MSGHSHWKQIKIKKAVSDEKRGKEFSKLLAAISIAARVEANPDFNPRLRTAVLKAKEAQVPQENIDRAIQKSKDSLNDLEEITLECYGPGGAAIIVEAVTSSPGRTINDLKLILKEKGGKLGEPGSVRWAFEKNEEGNWRAKFTQKIDEVERKQMENLLDSIENHDDVQSVSINAEF